MGWEYTGVKFKPHFVGPYVVKDVLPGNSSSVRTHPMPDGWTSRDSLPFPKCDSIHMQQSSWSSFASLSSLWLQSVSGRVILIMNWTTCLVLIDGSPPGRTNQRIPGEARGRERKPSPTLFICLGGVDVLITLFEPVCLSFFTYWWLCSSPRHTMGNFNMGFVIYWWIFRDLSQPSTQRSPCYYATIRSFILWMPFKCYVDFPSPIMFWLAHMETIASFHLCWCNSFAVVSDHFSPQPIPHTYRLPAFFPLPANLSEELYA